MFKYFALVLALSAVCSYAEYTAEDDVIELTTENFKELVLGNDEPWMVEFYAPWCGHCKKLEPEWKKAATALKDTVKLGAVDMTKHREAGKEYGIKGFPTIKLFANDKQNPTKYQGQRTAEAIGKAAADAVKKVEASRLKKQEDVPVKATETEEVRREL